MTEKRKPIGGAVLASLPTETLPRKQPHGENKIIASLREAREAVPSPTILKRNHK